VTGVLLSAGDTVATVVLALLANVALLAAARDGR
jgi:hypothetical protein